MSRYKALRRALEDHLLALVRREGGDIQRLLLRPGWSPRPELTWPVSVLLQHEF
jgi:hypothetical protein